MSQTSSQIVTIGGKGSALTASSLYAVACGAAQVRIDSSIIDKLSSSTRAHQSAVTPFSILPDEDLSLIESRATLLVLLNKLIVTGAPGVVTPVLLNHIAHFLNQSFEKCDIGVLDVTEGELNVITNCAAPLHGICAILDHEAAALSVVADFAAALACEALKADVSALNAVDSGDGFSSKDDVSVANDLKVLLNGSKFIGKFVNESVSEIPIVHGSLRKVVKSIHMTTRVGLNSGIKVGSGKSVATEVLALANALKYLCENSLSRAELILNLLADSSTLRGRLEANVTNFRQVVDLIFKSRTDHLKFVHNVYNFLKIVWDIVAWEAVLAFVSLDEASVGKAQTNEGNVSSDNKGEKKTDKKKKVVLGKGNGIIMQHIRETLQSEQNDLVDGLRALLNPNHTEFDTLLRKIKDTVESNDSRRLPKLPKVKELLFCGCFLILWYMFLL